ncbi:hypothetical protein [Microbacterium sp. cf332]|uniref:hypothetical protein n=1 Tax=Microbacterium sp. cf332 TaxID=1761804 RepID=UPI0008860429|nr:hypothetical protein [Microbacterium sp. cf332]SDQ30589.1 hypothetical protein SAMN04487847_1333 [Microbacterium sp. cf332]
MNNTNRAVNRTILLILGLVLVAIGAGVIAGAAVPAAADAWTSFGSGAEEWAKQAWDATTIAGTSLTWLAVGVLAALALLVVLLIVLIVRSIHGRRRTSLRATGSESDLGRITVTEGFAADALKNALADRDEILSARVTANDIKHEPVLHVSVTARQNTSPVHVAETVERLVANLGTLTGQKVTAYISIHSGLRAKLAHDQRRLS